LQYVLSSGSATQTQPMTLHSECLGSGSDPVAKTFEQIFSGIASNFVIWNDQLYEDPRPDITPSCEESCSAPWGHSKGFIAWDANGDGFVVQVTTPDWPGNGDNSSHRATQGNTLGCTDDDNVLVSQHFFGLRLKFSDTLAVLQAMKRASVVTDPSNTQLVKLTDSPGELTSLVKSLGQVDSSGDVLRVTLSTTTADGNKVQLFAKPHSLEVPTWQLVSALLQKPIRVASWWMWPKVDSTADGFRPGCWSDSLEWPKEVQVATSGRWNGKTFGLKGGSGTDDNHAKVAHSLTGSLSVMGDMNMQGTLVPKKGLCSSSQNGRGGLFFVLDDATLHSDITALLTGSTGPYADNTPDTTTTAATPLSCGGAGVHASTCRVSEMVTAGCVYVDSKDAVSCSVKGWGCYERTSLPETCPEIQILFD